MKFTKKLTKSTLLYWSPLAAVLVVFYFIVSCAISDDQERERKFIQRSNEFINNNIVNSCNKLAQENDVLIRFSIDSDHPSKTTCEFSNKKLARYNEKLSADEVLGIEKYKKVTYLKYAENFDKCMEKCMGNPWPWNGSAVTQYKCSTKCQPTLKETK